MSFQTCISFFFYFEDKIRYFEEPNRRWTPLISVVGKEILWKSMGTINCLITSILQSILFYVQNKKETHTGLERHEGKNITKKNFLGELSLQAQCRLRKA